MFIQARTSIVAASGSPLGGFKVNTVAGHTLVAFVFAIGGSLSFSIADATGGTNWQPVSSIASGGVTLQVWIAVNAPAGTHSLSITNSGNQTQYVAMLEDSTQGGNHGLAAVNVARDSITTGAAIGGQGDTIYGFTVDDTEFNSDFTFPTPNGSFVAVPMPSGAPNYSLSGFDNSNNYLWIGMYLTNAPGATTPTMTPGSGASASDQYLTAGIALWADQAPGSYAFNDDFGG